MIRLSILGSDTASLLDMKTRHAFSSKLVCHETLSLAIAVSGMAEFTVSNKETVVIQSLRDQFPAWGAKAEPVSTW